MNGVEILSLVVPLALGPLALYWVIRLAVRDAMNDAQRRQRPQDQNVSPR